MSGFKHFMRKEILEQPAALAYTLREAIRPGRRGSRPDRELGESFLRRLKHVVLVGCGTSHHAALTARYWLESLAGVPCQTEMSSEFRARRLFLNSGDLVICISQSGETADTLEALRLAKKLGAGTLAVCNAAGSPMADEAHSTLHTRSGPEIGVASTKAFTGQLTALLLWTLRLARLRRALPERALASLLRQAGHLPARVEEALKTEPQIRAVAKKFYKKEDFFYLGRGLNYPIALEGALKLKEISYIHAEGYAAGELKHGPIALLEPGTPVVALATDSAVRDKMIASIQTARSRGAAVIAVVSKGSRGVVGKAQETIFVPRVPETFSPIVNAVPLQFLAYHIALLRGCDIDRPRSLTKAVTVE